MTVLPSEMRVTTTPLLAAHCRYRSATLTTSEGDRFGHVAPRIWELLFRCLESAEVSDLLTEWSAEELAAAVDARLLVDAGAQQAATLSLWEHSNWIRMGHLLASQLDIPYLEQDSSSQAEVLAPLSQERREQIASYLAERPYPARARFEGDSIALEGRDVEPPLRRIDASYGRRSVRRFAPVPVSAEAFGSVLWTATANIRLAESSKESGDPYFLLNSFYTWADIYVVVQEVAGIERGVFRYDPLEHELFRVRNGVSDDEILATIARQPWALGTGAALYLCSQWDRYRFLYRHSRAYINLLIQVGELAQEFVTAISSWGLGCWESPAIQEKQAAALLDTPVGVDPVLFLKFGVPESAS